MCGILGVVDSETVKDKLVLTVKNGLKLIQYRGRDGSDIKYVDSVCIGHVLHSVVDCKNEPVLQPFEFGSGDEKVVFAANCEIYNWQELCLKYKIKAKNDAELIFKLIQQKGIDNLDSILKELDGVYAFVYFSDKKIYLARDLIGIKPLWYSPVKKFSFSSEKKALEKIGYVNVLELNPRKILIYDLSTQKISFKEREYFKIEPELQSSFEEIQKKVDDLLHKAILKRVPNKKFALLFSGGIDSTIIAWILKQKGYEFDCYTTVFEDPALKEPEDLFYAKKIAAQIGLNLKIIKIKIGDVEKYLKKIVPLIEDSNVVKVGVALTFFAACEQASKDGNKVIFSGLGSEEIFAGYNRHKQSQNVNNECLSGLIKIYERDLYRDDVITMFNHLELRLPLLDCNLAEYALKIPAKYKICEGHEKFVLRSVALKLGLSEEFVYRRKKAAQYGSNLHKALIKLTKKNGFKLKSEYLRQFYPEHNVNLGALISSGKDGIYAAWTMLRQNYKLGCFITIKSENSESFMFHYPAIDLVKLQAESMNVPLIIQETKGEKEKELDDLKTALILAKEKYGIQGVVSGALFSNYQRKRIETICDCLGLKIFSPLWHINQEVEMKQILDSGFKFMMTRVAAEGLDESWLGREIYYSDVDKLAEFDSKFGFNVAGEGGEFESLMLDGPIFEKSIKIIKSRKEMEAKNCGDLIVEKAELVDK
ncbi:diphthine--ammonia ligase [Candidatus Woesearchaeota archaeon]|jgi:diphthine-ammonia ligase|nr:diphthine--ammonia ligase [Candidatus Woesearchaeota archaeon]